VIGSFVVPFSVVVLFFELNTPRNVSAYQVGKMLMLGGAFSLFSTLFLFNFIPGSGVGSLIPALLTGMGEETGKALALLLVVGSIRYRWQLNGLLFGSAVGAGFAGFESAGYAFRIALDDGLGPALDNIMLRGLLAPGGHVIWTAMIGAAIWQVKGDRKFEVGMLFHRVVVRRWLVAVVLHGLWDSSFGFLPWPVHVGVLVVVGWYIVMAILRQAFAEVDAARDAAVGAAETRVARG
jgi:RsiW-degrading membrane proteinase PrsW (M82 family)